MNVVPQLSVEVFSSRFFQGLNQPVVDAVVAAGVFRHHSPGQMLTRTGEPATHVYLLLSGHAQSYVSTDMGKHLRTKCHNRGDLVGLRSLVPSVETYLFWTEVREPLDTLAWERDRIRQLCYQYPELFMNTIEVLSDFISDCCVQRRLMLASSAEVRLLWALRRLSRKFGRCSPRGMEFDITHEDLAEIAEVNAFTASRVLGQWQRRGLLKKSRGKVVLYSTDFLAETPSST